MGEMPSLGFVPPSYDDTVDTYELEILQAPGDWSIVDGDLAVTKDGDIKVGDTAYNALFRLVQEVRLSTPHLRFLFNLVASLQRNRKVLDDRMDAIGEEKRQRFDIKTFLQPDPVFLDGFHATVDEMGTADYGFATYGGCVALLLAGSLLRFKDDLGAKGDDWNKAAPLFGGWSFGQVIVAAANGFRHDDEWSKTRPPTPQQKASQDVLSTSLSGRTPPKERAPGRCDEVLALLSQGRGFEGLATNLFSFAHNVAVRIRAKGLT